MNPPRLSRLDFVFEQHPVYFVTACVHGHRNLLANKNLHESFRRFAKAAPDHRAWVGKYVLMPDHLHLFVALDDKKLTLSQWVKSLKGSLSAHFRAADVCPPFWQKGFFDHVLRSNESYSEKWDYFHQNPVRAELVSQSEDWPYAGEIFDLGLRTDLV